MIQLQKRSPATPKPKQQIFFWCEGRMGACVNSPRLAHRHRVQAAHMHHYSICRPQGWRHAGPQLHTLCPYYNSGRARQLCHRQQHQSWNAEKEVASQRLHQRRFQHCGSATEPAQGRQQRAGHCRHKTSPAQQGAIPATPTQQPLSRQKLLNSIQAVPSLHPSVYAASPACFKNRTCHAVL
jgi:hypothetical protein